MKDNTPEISQIYEELSTVMKREILFFREMLSSMQEERYALLNNNTAMLRIIINSRHSLIDTITELHDKRIKKIRSLIELLNADIKDLDIADNTSCMTFLSEYVGSENCRLISLKEQMLALLEKLEMQSRRNKNILENGITITKDFISEIQHKESISAHTLARVCVKEPKTKTLTITNQET